MVLSSFFKEEDTFVGVDIRENVIHLVELDVTEEGTILENFGTIKIDGSVMNNHIIVSPEQLSEPLSILLSTNEALDSKVVACLPGPTVFTKKIRMQKMPHNELQDIVQLEAGNFIPHSMSDVKLDFHILSELEGDMLEVLVVAVKSEVVDGVMGAFSGAEIEPAILDIDYYALQNAFEHAYPELFDSTVALIHYGERSTLINIVEEGKSLIVGSITAGSFNLIDELSSQLHTTRTESFQLLADYSNNAEVGGVLSESMNRHAEEIARQLSFLWTSVGVEHGISKAFVSGSAANTVGLVESISSAIKLECDLLNPIKNITIGEDVDPEVIHDLSSHISIACGLALRKLGDRFIPEDMK